MDFFPFQDLYANLLAQGLWQWATSLVTDRSEALTRPDPSTFLGDAPALVDALSEGAKELASVETIDPELGGERFRSFLQSDEISALLPDIYAFEASSDTRVRGRLRQALIASWAGWTGRDPADLDRHADRLLDALSSSCRRVLEAALADNVLAAHELTSKSRHSLVMERLNALERRIASRAETSQEDAQAIARFAGDYRDQIREHHALISPPALHGAPRIRIDQLYVEPRFRPRMSGRDREVVFAPEFTAAIYRTVVLGDPGGGKSTFTTKLCHDVAANYQLRLVGGRAVTPVRIVLRDFAKLRETAPYSIIEYIESHARTNYGLDVPDGAVRSLLVSGQTLVVFDGLDELLDTNQRRAMRDDIEAFCRSFPDSPVLVATREIDYDEAPLDPERFRSYRLPAFDETQVETYTRKWFSLDTIVSPDERERKIAAFVTDSRSLADLRSNPLMLALMCSIYHEEGDIPRNRGDVYARCARLLFEQWDPRRGLVTRLEFNRQVRRTIQKLAVWIYSSEARQEGVEQSALITRAAKILQERDYPDPDDAHAFARGLVEFCGRRAWVFSEIGSRENSEPVYRFSHETFLEFFTAEYLVREYTSATDLVDVLAPRVAHGEWLVVAELATQLLDEQSYGAADTILSAFLERALEPTAASNLLAFMARSLGFLSVRPEIKRQVVDASLDHALHPDDTGEPVWRTESIAHLLQAVRTMPGEHDDVLSRALRDRGETAQGEDFWLLTELALNLQTVDRTWLFAAEDATPTRFALEVSGEYADDLEDKIASAAGDDSGMMRDALDWGILSLEDFLLSSGFGALFDRRAYRLVASTSGSVTDAVLSSVTLVDPTTDLMFRLRPVREWLAVIGRSVPSEGPWLTGFDHFGAGWPKTGAHAARDAGPSTPDFDADAWFGLIVLTGTLLEASEGRPEFTQAYRSLRRSDSEIWRPVSLAMGARFGTAGDDEPLDSSGERETAEHAVEGLGMSVAQTDLLRSWWDREFRFATGPPEARPAPLPTVFS